MQERLWIVDGYAQILKIVAAHRGEEAFFFKNHPLRMLENWNQDGIEYRLTHVWSNPTYPRFVRFINFYFEILKNLIKFMFFISKKLINLYYD